MIDPYVPGPHASEMELRGIIKALRQRLVEAEDERGNLEGECARRALETGLFKRESDRRTAETEALRREVADLKGQLNYGGRL